MGLSGSPSKIYATSHQRTLIWNARPPDALVKPVIRFLYPRLCDGNFVFVSDKYMSNMALLIIDGLVVATFAPRV